MVKPMTTFLAKTNLDLGEEGEGEIMEIAHSWNNEIVIEDQSLFQEIIDVFAQIFQNF